MPSADLTAETVRKRVVVPILPVQILPPLARLSRWKPTVILGVRGIVAMALTLAFLLAIRSESLFYD